VLVTTDQSLLLSASQDGVLAIWKIQSLLQINQHQNDRPLPIVL